MRPVQFQHGNALFPPHNPVQTTRLGLSRRHTELRSPNYCCGHLVVLILMRCMFKAFCFLEACMRRRYSNKTADYRDMSRGQSGISCLWGTFIFNKMSGVGGTFLLLKTESKSNAVKPSGRKINTNALEGTSHPVTVGPFELTLPLYTFSWVYVCFFKRGIKCSRGVSALGLYTLARCPLPVRNAPILHGTNLSSRFSLNLNGSLLSKPAAFQLNRGTRAQAVPGFTHSLRCKLRRQGVWGHTVSVRYDCLDSQCQYGKKESIT